MPSWNPMGRKLSCFHLGQCCLPCVCKLPTVFKTESKTSLQAPICPSRKHLTRLRSSSCSPLQRAGYSATQIILLLKFNSSKFGSKFASCESCYLQITNPAKVVMLWAVFSQFHCQVPQLCLLACATSVCTISIRMQLDIVSLPLIFWPRTSSSPCWKIILVLSKPRFTSGPTLKNLKLYGSY